MYYQWSFILRMQKYEILIEIFNTFLKVQCNLILSCGSNNERSSSSIVASRLEILFREFGRDPKTVLRWLGSVSDKDIWDDACLDTCDIGDTCCEEDGDTVWMVAMDEWTMAQWSESSSDTVSLFAKHFVSFYLKNLL